jgi:glyoxylase-like metal-dependent hydrolase (beta-lactamase superfamily II)
MKRVAHRLLAATRAVLLLLAAPLLTPPPAPAQNTPPHPIAPGVWFLTGDTNGYSNTVIIEMRDYLIVVDANYPGRAKQLLALIPTLSPKPVRYVFDTHAHGDHAYGNSTWTAAGPTTLAFQGVTDEMNRWEPTRWRNSMRARPDLQATGETDVQRPQMSITGDKLTLSDGAREVDFLFLGWGHTPGDGYVWLPHERILATGDAAVNGPRNKLLDANLANWPNALAKAIALNPVHVLPGHGDAGGIEILQGQRQFLIDLYAAVKAQADAGKKPADMTITLPAPDNNWFPLNRADLRNQDIETVYLELTTHAPAGAAPHEWK